MSDQLILCTLFDKNAGVAKTRWVNVVETLAGTFYFVLALIGFRNIYVIFYKQRKLQTIIFPLMYAFGQLVCILQIT